MKNRLLILGLGNPILTDDGVGIYVVRRVRELLEDSTAQIIESSSGGFDLVELLAGYERVIIVDAFETDKVPPGEVVEISMDSLMTTSRLASVHGVNLSTALRMGRMMDLDMPDTVEVYGIVVQEARVFGEECTPVVKGAIEKAAQFIAERIRHIESERLCMEIS